MKYASFIFSRSKNLGDQIQALAAERLLPRVDARFDRDALNEVATAERYITLMNGWFSHQPENWPPSRSIIPIFVGFHLTPAAAKSYLRFPEYFRRYGSIGCRDHGTRQMLLDARLEAHLTYCPTLTFPARDRRPRTGTVFIVDGRGLAIPRAIRKNALEISHVIPKFYSPSTKMAMATELLDAYRTQATLVITTRIHSALPCIAMGIPVIYFGDADNYRQSIIKDLGIPYHVRAKNQKKGIFRRFNENVDWSGYTADVSAIAGAIRAEIRSRLDEANAAYDEAGESLQPSGPCGAPL